MVILVSPEFGLFELRLSSIIQLSQLRKKLPWSKSDSIITKLIYNTVETGAVTAVVAIVDVVLFISYPGNYLHEAPYVISAVLAFCSAKPKRLIQLIHARKSVFSHL
jgi:hypothetical protein